VAIDEQHRFGVKQRQELLAKGQKMPHLLTMTATPIPRSLQLTVFGELDVSVLDEMPKGRKKITTTIVQPTQERVLHAKITEELRVGRQAYFVVPLIEDNPESEKKSAEVEFAKVKKIYKNFNVWILHGKMKADEKERVMRNFAAKKIDVLVATTVVEVGVDVPNATVMVVQNADFFGLSQLHQLRGRVGRSEYQSYCYLILSDNKTPGRRLRELEKSTDGFYLAEVDLALRGPGEIYGTSQHGELNLQVANLADTKLISRAQKNVEEFVRKYDLADYPELRQVVENSQRLTTLN
jgi:ATP-dependent DNA helicase RecG